MKFESAEVDLLAAATAEQPARPPTIAGRVLTPCFRCSGYESHAQRSGLGDHA